MKTLQKAASALLLTGLATTFTGCTRHCTPIGPLASHCRTEFNTPLGEVSVDNINRPLLINPYGYRGYGRGYYGRGGVLLLNDGEDVIKDLSPLTEETNMAALGADEMCGPQQSPFLLTSDKEDDKTNDTEGTMIATEKPQALDLG